MVDRVDRLGLASAFLMARIFSLTLMPGACALGNLSLGSRCRALAQDIIAEARLEDEVSFDIGVLDG